jgi:hypothetical protein
LEKNRRFPAKNGISAEFLGKIGIFCQEMEAKNGMSRENTYFYGNYVVLEKLWIYTENFGITGNYGEMLNL